MHTELHQPQQMKSGPQNYQPMRKVNNHFIGEETRNYQRGLQKQVEKYNPDLPTTFDPQNYQPMIKANNRFIIETSSDYEGERPQWYDRYPTSGLQAPRENLINQNIAEECLTQIHQEVSLATRQQMYRENVINHVSTDIYQTQQEPASGSQHIQTNQEVQLRERVNDNSINCSPTGTN